MARALSPARPGPATRPDRDAGQATRPYRDTGHAVALHGVSKVYRPGRRTVTALRGVHLTFPRGSCTAVMGASGSGKTTLLQCAAGLDRPVRGILVPAALALLGDRSWYFPRWLEWLPGWRLEPSGPEPLVEPVAPLSGREPEVLLAGERTGSRAGAA